MLERHGDAAGHRYLSPSAAAATVPCISKHGGSRGRGLGALDGVFLLFNKALTGTERVSHPLLIWRVKLLRTLPTGLPFLPEEVRPTSRAHAAGVFLPGGSEDLASQVGQECMNTGGGWLGSQRQAVP